MNGTEEKKKLFAIGDVAQMFHISVSSLRYYEKAGLLMPEKVDPNSGYRYYSTRQFEVLNTIRYLRALDMPLPEIADFLQNKEVSCIEEKLQQQKETVMRKQQELLRIERKIDNRLRQLREAQDAVLDQVELVMAPECKLVWASGPLKVNGSLDMEAPIRQLEQSEAEAIVFLGKVGVAISAEHLESGEFEAYDGIFLVLDEEDRFEGNPMTLPETLCVRVRFRGSHAEAARQYQNLLGYIRSHKLEISGFSREITMIDFGITNDPEKFITQICIPVRCR